MSKKQDREAEMKPKRTAAKLPPADMKKIQPLVERQIDWNIAKKNVESLLKDVNMKIEIMLTQAGFGSDSGKYAEMAGHKVTVLQGANVSCDWEQLKIELLRLTNDPDEANRIMNDVRNVTEYSYITVLPIRKKES